MICRRFGEYYRHSRATGLILLNNLQCNGNETSFDNCTHGGWGVGNYGYSRVGEDVSIRCLNGKL